MKKVKGNLLDMAEQGEFDIILHGCNCFNTMNSGIAKEIKERFPEAYRADCQTRQGEKNKLGKSSHAIINGSTIAPFMIMNLYTQYNYRENDYDTSLYVDYTALRNALHTIAKTERLSQILGQTPMKIGYPKIGCGKANGDWEIVKNIIEEELTGLDHTYVEFEKLPTSWKDVFNTSHSLYSLQSARNTAAEAGYNYFSWNNRIVSVDNPILDNNTNINTLT